GRIVAGRIVGYGVRVPAAIAGGGNEHLTLGAGVGDGVGHDGTRLAAPVTVVRHFGPVVGGVVNRQGPVEVRATAVCPQELEGHELALPIHPGHAHPVVTRGEDRAAGVRAVAVVV